MAPRSPVASCRERLMGLLAASEAAGAAAGLLALAVPGARRVEQYPTGEELLPVRQPSTFVYVAGDRVQLHDCVCVVLRSAEGPVTAQLVVPGCDPDRRQFDGCDPDAFDGKVVARPEIPADAALFYLDHGGSAAVFDPTGVLPKRARPLKNGLALLARSRRVKTPDEIACVEAACATSCRSLRQTIAFLGRTRARARRDPSEAELAALFAQRCARYGSIGDMAFPPIVASGPAASTLHHAAGRGAVRRERPVIFDVGGRVRGYCADISVTLPGENRAWRRVHREVCNALAGLERALEPGVTWERLAERADREMYAALRRAGLLLGTPEEEPDRDTVRQLVRHFMPHSCGHHMGLDTHDACGPQGLEEGAVVALELGVYTPPAGALPAGLARRLAAERLAELGAGGVRVEDDLVVVRGGSDNLTRAALAPLRAGRLGRLGRGGRPRRPGRAGAGAASACGGPPAQRPEPPPREKDALGR